MKVAIWSGEHGAYWRDSGHGYTTKACDAGKFDVADATRKIKGLGPEKACRIVMIECPDGGCCHHLCEEHCDRRDKLNCLPLGASGLANDWEPDVTRMLT